MTASMCRCSSQREWAAAQAQELRLWWRVSPKSREYSQLELSRTPSHLRDGGEAPRYFHSAVSPNTTHDRARAYEDQRQVVPKAPREACWGDW